VKVGEFVQVPLVVVKVEPTVREPLATGAAVLAGTPKIDNAFDAADRPGPMAFIAVTVQLIDLPASLATTT
jgi:hypothetical protein